MILLRRRASPNHESIYILNRIYKVSSLTLGGNWLSRSQRRNIMGRDNTYVLSKLQCNEERDDRYENT